MIEELVTGLVSWSEQFIVPDWGALVALIPLGLAGLVLLYLTWAAYRFATAGPTRRGKRRLPPVAPAGIHMPGPSFAPLLAATGFFFLVFGMVAGGTWLAVGAVVLVVTLLFWGREEMRDFDRSRAGAAGGSVAAGALPSPRGTPPAGVHVPPPSFRPLLVALSATMLVAGLVVGGSALVLGFVAFVLTTLGWLWDARREYTATVAADRTGHLDLGGAPAWPKGTFAGLAILVALALVFSSGLIGGSGGEGGGTATASGGPGASGAPGAGGGGGGGEPSPAPSTGTDADVLITALRTNWVEPDVSAPAGAPFTLAFDNQDSGMPHDVVITDGLGAEIFRTELVTGPAVVVYDVPAIPPGQYAFVCTVHPNMKGTVTAQ